jgi:hypothetical protein
MGLVFRGLRAALSQAASGRHQWHSAYSAPQQNTPRYDTSAHLPDSELYLPGSSRSSALDSPYLIRITYTTTEPNTSLSYQI